MYMPPEPDILQPQEAQLSLSFPFQVNSPFLSEESTHTWHERQHGVTGQSTPVYALQ